MQAHLRLIGWFQRVIAFVREAWAELKKVTWPSWQETWTFTKVVLLVILVFGAYLGALDAFFAWLMRSLGIYRF